MTENICTGWIAANWAGDLDWAHWMWSCDESCPMDVEMNRRLDGNLADIRAEKTAGAR